MEFKLPAVVLGAPSVTAVLEAEQELLTAA
jgi:hypothetical protein